MGHKIGGSGPTWNDLFRGGDGHPAPKKMFPSPSADINSAV